MLDQSAKAEGTERVTLAAARLTLARANPNGEHDAHRLETKPEPEEVRQVSRLPKRLVQAERERFT